MTILKPRDQGLDGTVDAVTTPFYWQATYKSNILFSYKKCFASDWCFEVPYVEITAQDSLLGLELCAFLPFVPLVH